MFGSGYIYGNSDLIFHELLTWFVHVIVKSYVTDTTRQEMWL